MKLKPKIEKKHITLAISFLLMLSFVQTVYIPKASAQTTTKLTVDSVIDADLTPGSTFTIYIWVWDVEAMFGYNFFVYYDTSVLTATSFMRYPPFTIDFPSDIDDTLGVVALAASMPSPELVGFYWSGAYPIASIDFSVDALGTSLLDLLSGSVISDIHGDLIIHTIVDGYFSNTGETPHDVAVTAIQVSPTRDITPGEPVSVNVTVANQGPNEETFTLTTYADSTEIGSESVTLSMLSETIVTFQWDTTGFAFDHYDVGANASIVPGETDTDDNTLIFDDVVVVGTHDVAVTAVTVTPTNVVVGEPVYIDVTVANQGNFTETFNVTTKYGYLPPAPVGAPPEIQIDTKPVTSMAAGAETTLTFTLDTSSVAFLPPHEAAYLWIQANVSEKGEPAVPYETNTANNWFSMIGNVTVWQIQKQKSTITISASKTTILLGETVTISGSITPTRIGASVTIQYRQPGDWWWNDLAIVTTNETSQYSYDWTPWIHIYELSRTYELRAIWFGDEATEPAESDTITIIVIRTPPSITIDPTSGPAGTKVTVKGINFPPTMGYIMFDDQLIGLITPEANGSLNLAFNVPISQAGAHTVKVMTGYYEWLKAEAPFTVIDVTPLDITADAGTIYFKQDTAEFYIQTIFKGTPIDATSIQATLYKPDGTTETLTPQRITTGLYKIQYVITGKGSMRGTYTLKVEASYATETVNANGTSIKTFLVKSTWERNAPKIAALSIASIGLVSAIILLWRKEKKKFL